MGAFTARRPPRRPDAQEHVQAVLAHAILRATARPMAFSRRCRICGETNRRSKIHRAHVAKPA
jgi:hypothetical protein